MRFFTARQTLKQVTDRMKLVVDKNSNCRIHRCTGKQFSASSIDYELVFYAKVTVIFRVIRNKRKNPF